MPYSLQGLLIQLEASIIIANKVSIQTNKLVDCLLASFSQSQPTVHRTKRLTEMVYSSIYAVYALQPSRPSYSVGSLHHYRQQAAKCNNSVTFVWKQGYINRYILFIDQVEAVIFLK